MKLMLLTAFLLGVLNALIVRFIILRSLNKSNSSFLKMWGLAFFYKSGFLAACFFMFYKFQIPYMISFFITLILTQTLIQVVLFKKVSASRNLKNGINRNI